MSSNSPPPRITVLIPALDEEEALPKVLRALPWPILHEAIVVDNGSTDGTAAVAGREGARVVSEPRRGYGAACLAGIRAIRDTDVLVFLDGDYSDHPEELPRLVEPIAAGRADFVVGSRTLGRREPGALLRLLFGVRYTDLGPFRAIRWRSLLDLGMRDRGFGWTVEMQIRAARERLRIEEVPVSYRRRVGRSKITGTVKGAILAGLKILWTIGRHAILPRRGRTRLTEAA